MPLHRCNKNYKKGSPIVPPGGKFPVPATSDSTLLAFRCTPVYRPYIRGCNLQCEFRHRHPHNAHLGPRSKANCSRIHGRVPLRVDLRRRCHFGRQQGLRQCDKARSSLHPTSSCPAMNHTLFLALLPTVAIKGITPTLRCHTYRTQFLARSQSSMLAQEDCGQSRSMPDIPPVTHLCSLSGFHFV